MLDESPRVSSGAAIPPNFSTSILPKTAVAAVTCSESMRKSSDLIVVPRCSVSIITLSPTKKQRQKFSRVLM